MNCDSLECGSIRRYDSRRVPAAFLSLEKELMSSVDRPLHTATHLSLRLEPCPHRPSQLLTDATSNPSTSACSKTSATGSSATTSTVRAPAPSAPSLSAIGTLVSLNIIIRSNSSSSARSKKCSRSPCARCDIRKGRGGTGS